MRLQILKRVKQPDQGLWWARNFTETKDQQYLSAGLPTPYNPFPSYSYLEYVFDFLDRSPKLTPVTNPKVRLIPKSRKTMLSWACMAKLVHRAQVLPEQELIVQSQQQKKGNYLIEYAKCLYERQPDWMREEFPLTQAIDDFAMDRLEWVNGSKIISIPEGADQIRTFHPTVMFEDEAAFQSEGEGAYDSGLSAAELIWLISSPGPGWFQELVDEVSLPPSAVKLDRGVYFTETKNKIPALWVHYSAIPNRDEAWVMSERPNYKLESSWKREQELDFLAGGGERVLREIMLRKLDQILITDKTWKPSPFWRYDAGFDWGKTNPTSFIPCAIDENGCHYAISEHYQCGPEMTPNRHTPMMHAMKLPNSDTLVMSVLGDSEIWADPSIFYKSQATAAGEFTSIAELFDEANPPIKNLVAGKAGEDLTFVEMLIQLWDQPDPMFKIFCPQPFERKILGTTNGGCPNLVWELMNLRREQFTPTQLQKKNPTERLVDQNNHAFDALKYRFLSRPEPAEIPVDEKYRRYCSTLPPVRDVNAGIARYETFMKRQTPQNEATRWA